MRYLIDHWRGNLSLSVSLWINLVALLVVLAIVESLVLLQFSADPERMIRATIISLVITRLLIYPWQVIGLLRSSDHHFLQQRKSHITRAVYLVVILSIGYTFFYVIGTLQTVFIFKNDMDSYARLVEQSGYSLTVSDDGKQVTVAGALDIGITRDLNTSLETNPDVVRIVLDSPGGQIYQGRGIAQIIRTLELDTYVENTCSSACVTAFIAGRERSIAPGAKLGFHQYRFDPTQTRQIIPLYASLQSEQEKDLQLFRDQGVKAEFLQRVFERSAHEMWYPDVDLLLDMQVVHEITGADLGE